MKTGPHTRRGLCGSIASARAAQQLLTSCRGLIISPPICLFIERKKSSTRYKRFYSKCLFTYWIYFTVFICIYEAILYISNLWTKNNLKVRGIRHCSMYPCPWTLSFSQVHILIQLSSQKRKALSVSFKLSTLFSLGPIEVLVCFFFF